jgi:hypothetical protein
MLPADSNFIKGQSRDFRVRKLVELKKRGQPFWSQTDRALVMEANGIQFVPPFVSAGGFVQSLARCSAWLNERFGDYWVTGVKNGGLAVSRRPGGFK